MHLFDVKPLHDNGYRPDDGSALVGVGVTKPIFSVPLFSHFIPNDQNSSYLHDIKFIFGRCHRSWAAETPGKYEHDQNYLTYTFAKSKFPVTEKLANGALVTPIPGKV